MPPPSTAVPANASSYMKECAKNGVPLPPVWGDPKWVNQGSISKDKGQILPFFDSLPTADVWVSKSPLGTCFALARKDEKGQIQRLDQICQSQRNGKACFWDNTSPTDGETPQRVVDGLDPANVAGADKMKMNCTRCHRGDAFIIHPGTPLQLGPGDIAEKADPTSKLGRTDPDKRFEPIGRKPHREDSSTGSRRPSRRPESDRRLRRARRRSVLGVPFNPEAELFVLRLRVVADDRQRRDAAEAVGLTPKANPAKYAKDIEAIRADCLKKMNENLANEGVVVT